MPMSSERAGFSALNEATRHDWDLIDRAERVHRLEHGPGAGLLTMLATQKDGNALGMPVNLYTHCLQTATRVLEAGRDDELIVVALFHDLPEAFSDNHHGWLAAQMLSPWLSERRAWLLTHHVEFQNKHFANHPTRNPNEWQRYLGHECFDETAEFCEHFDQNSFDPNYPTLPLEIFRPAVQRFFSGPVPPLRTPPLPPPV